ncbi:MAG: hypothetical protein QW331_02535 [Candidatus Woesearchaeota archaeon]
MKNKKGDVTISPIVLLALGAIALVILTIFAVRHTSRTSAQLEKCSTARGKCVSAPNCFVRDQFNPYASGCQETCKEGSLYQQTDCELSKKVCCIG